MCTYFVLNKYYYIIILYGGSHASDILHVLMGVSVAKLIIYNIVLLFICHNKRSSSSSSSSLHQKYPICVSSRSNLANCVDSTQRNYKYSPSYIFTVYALQRIVQKLMKHGNDLNFRLLIFDIRNGLSKV